MSALPMHAAPMRRPDHGAVAGAAARRFAAPAQPAARLRRLQAVAPGPQTKARPRTIAALIAIGSVVLLSLGQLALSIALSSGAYELSSLRGDVRELGRTANALSEELSLLSSPQSLAESAAALGMVNPATPAFLRLSDGTVLGSPKAASGSAKATQTAAWMIPNGLLSRFQNPLQSVLEQSDVQAEQGGAGPAASEGETEPGTGAAASQAGSTAAQTGSSEQTGVLAGPTTR